MQPPHVPVRPVRATPRAGARWRIMRPRTLTYAMAMLALAAPSASAATFGAPYSIDLTAAAPLASAIDAGGAAVVGDVRGTAGKRRVEVALRDRAGAPWMTTMLGAEVSEARDVQAAIGGRGVVVAWAEVTREQQSVVVATGPAGGPLAIRRRLAVVDAYAASPRLAGLRGGAVVLAWRDGRSGSRSRVRVATIDGDRFTSAPRTVGTDVAQVVLAARGAGAAVGWTSAYRGRARKTASPFRARGRGRSRSGRSMQAAGRRVRRPSWHAMSIGPFVWRAPLTGGSSRPGCGRRRSARIPARRADTGRRRARTSTRSPSRVSCCRAPSRHDRSGAPTGSR